MTSSRPDRTEFHLSRARGSLRQLIVSYSQHLRSAKKRMPNPSLETQLDTELAKLKVTLDKLDRNIVRLAVFGLVSRGKSAVINALLGEDLLETAPQGDLSGNRRSTHGCDCEAGAGRGRALNVTVGGKFSGDGGNSQRRRSARSPQSK